MKHPFKRIVILLNDLENMESLLKKGVTFSNEHNALLEVLFVHEVPLFEVPDYFLSDEKISKTILDKVKIKEEIEKRLKNLNFEKEHVVLIYNNDTIDRLMSLIKEEKSTLVLTQYHEELSSQLIEKTPYTFWILKDKLTTYTKVAFTIDLEDKFKPYLLLTNHIFSNTKVELIHNYRYMLDPLVTTQDYLIVEPMTKETDIELNKVVRDQQIKIFNDYKQEYNLKGTFLEGEGVFNDDLISHIQDGNFDLTVLCRDNEDIFFTTTVVTELIKKVSTDFFVCRATN